MNCTNDKRNICNNKPQCLCSIVVDDANNVCYIYGKPGTIVHENYHVPGGDCLTFTGVMSAGFEPAGRMGADEFFEGEQDNNNIYLEHRPMSNSRTLVFLNGLKQREGAEHDYTISGDKIHFNFYELISTDVVEVMYEYEVE